MPTRESASYQLGSLRQAIAQLSVKRDLGENNFTKSEPAVRELLRSLEGILTHGVYPESHAIDFIYHCLTILPQTPGTHDPAQRVDDRNFQDKTEQFQYWLIMCLTHPGSLKRVVELSLNMDDVVLAYYMEEALVRTPDFRMDFLELITSLHAHPGTLSITQFRLDVTAMQLFAPLPPAEEQKVQPVRRRTIIKKKVVHRPHGGLASGDVTPRPADQGEEPGAGRPRAGTTNGDHPPHHHHHHTPTASATQQYPSRQMAEACAQTDSVDIRDAVAPGSPTSGGSPINNTSFAQTDSPAPNASYEELCLMDRRVTEREERVLLSTRRLKAAQEESDEQRERLQEEWEKVDEILVGLQALYEQLSDASKKGSRVALQQADPRIPQILRILRNEPNAEAAAPAPAPTRRRETDTTRPHTTPRSELAAQGDDQPSQPPPLPQVRTQLPSQREPVHVDPAPAVTTPTKPEAATTPTQAPTQPIVAPPTSPPPKAHQLDVETDLIVVEMPDGDPAELLRAQDHKCFKCHESLKQPSSIIKKVSSVNVKPRKCHYTGRMYCGKCHHAKTMALPSRILNHWDFSLYEVCDESFEAIERSADDPTFDINKLARTVTAQPKVQRVVALRRRLHKMYLVAVQCPNAGTLPMEFCTYYFVSEHLYSLQDFIRLRYMPDGKSSPPDDLEAKLQKSYALVAKHMSTSCTSCRARTHGKCVWCDRPEQIVLYEDNAAQCATCGTLYHAACHEAMGCKRCK